jgi:biopolymer transport protein ExbD
MKLTPIQKRAERKSRNQSHVDMNLVALIDIFTILIFFLLSSTAGADLLGSPRAVKLPESTAEKAPRETVVVIVAGDEILVEGRKVASVTEAMALQDDVIPPLKAELDLQSGRKFVRAENAAQGKAVTIMGDKDIPYRLLRKVMVTCARADFADVAFAVRQQLKVADS